MKEVFDIIKAYDLAVKEGRQTALATVVKVEGSSYRRPGARMLVTDDGQLTGAISGGCLEGDALRRALHVMQQQEPALVTYDTTDEEDAKLGVQLGCNGIVHILIEPVSNNDNNAIELLRKITSKRRDAVIATLFSLTDKKWEQAGTYALLTEENHITSHLPDALLTDMQAAMLQKISGITEYESVNALIDYLPPAVSLILFGAGNDAIPVMKMAFVMGWQITVVDGRNNYITAARFPDADKLLIAKPDEAIGQLSFDENTVAVLMTHNYNYDIAMLQHLLPLQLSYIGLLGPKSKQQRMLDELDGRGFIVTEEQRQSLYGPTGLDIGAETAEEIALSVVSEIKMVMSRRNGTSLRKKETTIHAGN